VYGGACASAPAGRDCTTLWVQALNAARAGMGAPAYTLPSRFRSLTPAERLLVLADQDRRLYGRVPVSGLNRTLDASAAGGVAGDADPAFVSPVSGYPLFGGASNWAGGSGLMSNPLFAYYLWMYDDGPGSGNLDCAAAGDPGCWGHRDGTLADFGPSARLLLGASGGAGRAVPYGWTELFEAFAASAAIPLIPTVDATTVHTGRAGDRLQITGFGLGKATSVTVVGHFATITARQPNSLVVQVPAGSGSGWVVVHTDGGVSNKTDAAAFAYA
jgi:hypothetical protein